MKMDRKLTKPDAPKRPRDRKLPGIDDGPIREIEQAAADYADVRDRRMELTSDETQRKQALLALMHKHRKTHYKRNGLEITLEAGQENVKVKMKPPTEEDDEETADDARE
jgi:hypothetical protein